MRAVWTEEMTNSLSSGWKEGLTLTQLAQQFGTSRHAVGGKLHRLGLMRIERPDLTPKREKKEKPKSKLTNKYNPSRPKRKMIIPEIIFEGDELGSLVPETITDTTNLKPLTELKENQCRWPYENSNLKVKATLFCGNPVTHPRYSFCNAHCAVAFDYRPANNKSWFRRTRRR